MEGADWVYWRNDWKQGTCLRGRRIARRMRAVMKDGEIRPRGMEQTWETRMGKGLRRRLRQRCRQKHRYRLRGGIFWDFRRWVWRREWWRRRRARRCWGLRLRLRLTRV